MYSKEISIPQEVNFEVSSTLISVSGNKGKLDKPLRLPKDIKMEKMDSKVKVFTENERRKSKAIVGTAIAQIRNMIEGVQKGFTYKLKVVYSHFPVTVKAEKDKIVIQNFLGERKPRIAKIVGNVEVKIDGQDITVSGIDVDEVGLTAHNLEQATRRTGFDKKVFMDGIYITSRE